MKGTRGHEDGGWMFNFDDEDTQTSTLAVITPVLFGHVNLHYCQQRTFPIAPVLPRRF
jgi:hypothetical protein